MVWFDLKFKGVFVFFFSLSFLQIYQLLSGARVFSPWVHQIIFSPKWEENLEGEIWWLNDKNAHVQIANGLQNIASLFFYPFSLLGVCLFSMLPLFLFFFLLFFFSFDFLGLWHGTLFCFHFCFFCFFFLFCLTRHTFFSRHNFYFFNKFGWLIFFFFWLLITFLF